MKVLIVGAGLAGLRTAESLRTHGYTDKITIIGDEPNYPYNRPPLSKSSLAEILDHGKHEFKRSEKISDVDWIFSDSATSLDMDSQELILKSGKREGFDILVAATGIRPRRLNLPGSEKEIFTLRSIKDATALLSQLSLSKKIVIIGAGFIGSEFAATARRHGAAVCVVAADPEPMCLSLGEKLGAAMRKRHESEGVEFFMNARLKSIIGDERARGVQLESGEEILGDLLLEAVGSLPNTEWLTQTGVDISNGVLVDENMQSEGASKFPIFAVGDVARYRFDLFDEREQRIEHWNLPTESGRRAGENIARLAAALPLLNQSVDFIPAFWSDQYDYRLQSFGMPHLADRREVVAGDVTGPCIVEYFYQGQLIGVVGIDSTAQLLRYKKEFAARGKGVGKC